MSVVVIDGNMPTGYDSCWYLDCKCWKECYINGKPDNCPLRPLPEKHGGLVDVNVLLGHMKKIHDKWKMEGHYTPTTDDEIMTMNMPIIVEAEGK